MQYKLLEDTEGIRFNDFFNEIINNLWIKKTDKLIKKNWYFQTIISMYIDWEEDISFEFFLWIKGYEVKKMCENIQEAINYLKENKKDFKEWEIIVWYAYIWSKVVIWKQISDDLSVRNNISLLLSDLGDIDINLSL